MKKNSIIALIMMVLSTISIIIPITQERTIFTNASNKHFIIGPLSPNRAVSFELNTGESFINKIILPLKRVGTNKKNGKIIYNIYVEDELIESGSVKYEKIEKQMINNELQLTIDIEKENVAGLIRVELYGEGLKSRINILASGNQFSNFCTYLGERKLNNNVMCSIIGEQKGHPFTWEIILLTIVSIMCIFIKGENNEKENNC